MGVQVQGLRGNVARTYAAGVEAPHDRAVEVLPPIDSSISPRVADLRSRPEDGHHRYKCSRPGRQDISIAAATPAAAPRSSESEILGVAALPRSPVSAGTADLFPRLQPEQAPTPMLLQRRHWDAPVLRSI